MCIQSYQFQTKKNRRCEFVIAVVFVKNETIFFLSWLLLRCKALIVVVNCPNLVLAP